MIHDVLESEPPPMEGVDPALERIARRAISKAPASRYASAAELRDALQAWRRSESGNPSGRDIERSFESTGTRGRWMLLGVAVLVFAAGGGVWALRSGRSDRDGQQGANGANETVWQQR